MVSLPVWALLFLDAIPFLPLPTSFPLREEVTHLKLWQVEAASVSPRQTLLAVALGLPHLGSPQSGLPLWLEVQHPIRPFLASL